MAYQEHNLQQGGEAWHQFRSTHFGASEASAMLGLSKYTTRSELLHQKHTGLAKEHSELTQAIFARGHETEEMARPFIEAMIGELLSPMVCSDGNISCSCDGITFDDSIAWEHKQDNNALFDSVARGIMPEDHLPQCQQVLLITGADKLIFTVSNGTQQRMTSLEVYPDQAWFERIRNGWAQFEKDLANYVPAEYIPAAVAAPIKDLPAVLIEVKGEIRINDNLTVFADLLNKYIAGVDQEPNDDQGFADMKAGIGALKKAEDALEAGEQHALAQLTTFDEMRRMKKSLQDLARTNRLSWEKIIVAREKQIKEDIALSAKAELAAHIDGLNKLIGKPYLPAITADFAAAMKNQRTLKSLREKVNNELVRAKMEASTIGQNIVINMKSLQEYGSEHKFLLMDAAMLVLKANDDLIALVKMRIADHEAAEVKKQEELRIAMQAEADRKAQEAADAVIAKAKAEQEAKAKAEREEIERVAQQAGYALAQEQARIKEEERTKAQEEAKTFADGLAKAHTELHQELPDGTCVDYRSNSHGKDGQEDIDEITHLRDYVAELRQANNDLEEDNLELYATIKELESQLADAAPVPAVPEGMMLVQIEKIEEMLVQIEKIEEIARLRNFLNINQ